MNNPNGINQCITSILLRFSPSFAKVESPIVSLCNFWLETSLSHLCSMATPIVSKLFYDCMEGSTLPSRFASEL